MAGDLNNQAFGIVVLLSKGSFHVESSGASHLCEDQQAPGTTARLICKMKLLCLKQFNSRLPSEMGNLTDN